MFENITKFQKVIGLIACTAVGIGIALSVDQQQQQDQREKELQAARAAACKAATLACMSNEQIPTEICDHAVRAELNDSPSCDATLYTTNRWKARYRTELQQLGKPNGNSTHKAKKEVGHGKP